MEIKRWYLTPWVLVLLWVHFYTSNYTSTSVKYIKVTVLLLNFVLFPALVAHSNLKCKAWVTWRPIRMLNKWTVKWQKRSVCTRHGPERRNAHQLTVKVTLPSSGHCSGTKLKQPVTVNVIVLLDGKLFHCYVATHQLRIIFTECRGLYRTHFWNGRVVQIKWGWRMFY